MNPVFVKRLGTDWKGQNKWKDLVRKVSPTFALNVCTSGGASC